MSAIKRVDCTEKYQSYTSRVYFYIPTAYHVTKTQIVTFIFPLRTSLTKVLTFSVVSSLVSGLYFVMSSSAKLIRRTVGISLVSIPKNSEIRLLSSTSESTRTKRTCPLKSLAAAENPSWIPWNSSAFLLAKSRTCFFTSPPKILGAFWEEKNVSVKFQCEKHEATREIGILLGAFSILSQVTSLCILATLTICKVLHILYT